MDMTRTLHGYALNDIEAAQLSAIRDRYLVYMRDREGSEAARQLRRDGE